MKRTYPKILRNRKRRIQRRLDAKRGWSNQAEPIITARNIHYEMAGKSRAINCGGIGAIHLMVNKLGLRKEYDSRLHLLKKHLPYHESDHVLNLTYNALLEGVRLEDIELRGPVTPLCLRLKAQLDGQDSFTISLKRKDGSCWISVNFGEGILAILQEQFDGALYQAKVDRIKDLEIIFDAGIFEVFANEGAVCADQAELPDPRRSRHRLQARCGRKC